MKAAARMPKNIGFYIIGDEPTTEYLQIKKDLALSNVHFAGFKTKKELAIYYQAANCTAFPTREDIWGLITNEAMACGLPVVASDRCISALEMIKDGVNGYIVPVEDDETLANKIQLALSLNAYQACIDTAMKFTTEIMAKTHSRFFLK